MSKYTVIPQSYVDSYDDWFSADTIKNKYNGDVLKASADHPIYHIYYLVGFKLRLYQVYMIDLMVKGKYVQAIWGRRLGKSLVYKCFAFWAMHWNKFPQGLDKSTKVVVLAHTGDSAESYIAELRYFIDAGDKQVNRLFKGKLGEKYFSDRFPIKGSKKTAKKRDNNEALDYLNINGTWSSIEVYPPTTRARGRPASIVLLDELAFWCDYTPDEEKIYSEVVRPIITDEPNTKIFIASTPNGEKGLFYKLADVDGHKTRYKLVWFSYKIREDKEYQDLILEYEEEYKDQGQYEAFRQEYLAEFVSSKGAYFDILEVDNVFKNDLQLQLRYSGECTCAIDFGGSQKSHTTITIARPVKGKDYKGRDCTIGERVYDKRYPIGQDSMLQTDVKDIRRRFNITKWVLDSQGGGTMFYGWFKREMGGDKIEECSFKKEKVDMYRLFKIACFQDRVSSYIDNVLRSEFTAFTGDLKPSKGYTDDLLDGFVMAVKGWIGVTEEFGWKSIVMNKHGTRYSNEWSPDKSLRLR